jgi:DNA-binding CsgD family transcriptional regulator
MFDSLLAQLERNSSPVIERAEGVAFFKAAKDLYRLADITYVCVNLCILARRKHFAHCFYSDTCVKQFTSQDPIVLSLPAASQEDGIGLVIPLSERAGETAVFKASAQMTLAEWRTQEAAVIRECRILANYFHSHVLRINGHDAERELLVSARELDCLKWTAAGKTAWEASVILGISERTVRFHLNAAREKLKCSNTTQAVAKAIVNQLIDLS